MLYFKNVNLWSKDPFVNKVSHDGRHATNPLSKNAKRPPLPLRIEIIIIKNR